MRREISEADCKMWEPKPMGMDLQRTAVKYEAKAYFAIRSVPLSPQAPWGPLVGVLGMAVIRMIRSRTPFDANDW